MTNKFFEVGELYEISLNEVYNTMLFTKEKIIYITNERQKYNISLEDNLFVLCIKNEINEKTSRGIVTFLHGNNIIYKYFYINSEYSVKKYFFKLDCYEQLHK